MKTLLTVLSAVLRTTLVSRRIKPVPTGALLGLCMGMLAGCQSDAQAPADCVCTTEFVTISFTVVDDTDTPLPGITVQSRIQRTGEVLQIDQLLAAQGVYFVATDSQIKDIRHAGEILVVEVAFGQRIFTEAFEVNVPGACACHIAKVSGPDKIMIGRASS